MKPDLTSLSVNANCRVLRVHKVLFPSRLNRVQGDLTFKTHTKYTVPVCCILSAKECTSKKQCD